MIISKESKLLFKLARERRKKAQSNFAHLLTRKGSSLSVKLFTNRSSTIPINLINLDYVFFYGNRITVYKLDDDKKQLEQLAKLVLRKSVFILARVRELTHNGVYYTIYYTDNDMNYSTFELSEYEYQMYEETIRNSLTIENIDLEQITENNSNEEK